MRARGLPAVGDRVGRRAPFDRDRPIPAAVGPQEGVPLRVEPGDRLGAGEEREVVAPLPVLGLVVDDAVLHLDLADRVVPLEVRGVVLRIPEAELDGAEEREACRLSPLVRQASAPHLQGLALRDEVQRLDADAVIARRDHGVAEAVTARVLLQLALRGLPAGAPVIAGRVVADVEIPPTDVERCVVVAIARQAAEPGVAEEGVPARGVRDDPEVFLAAEVVDPREGRVGSGDDVLASDVVEMPVAHGNPLCDASVRTATGRTR